MAIEQYKCRCAAICKGKIEDCIHPNRKHCVFDYDTGFNNKSASSDTVDHVDKDELAKQASVILDPNRPKPKSNVISSGWFERDDDYHSEMDKYNACGHIKKYDADIYVRRTKR